MRLTTVFRTAAAPFVVAAVLASAAPAMAQDAADSEGLSDIIVTAQRRAENQKDVPISVATVRGDTLAAVSGSGADIRALSVRVPSLNI